MTDEEFKNMLIFYLTTMSARTAQYCYFNFLDNDTVVLCNSTSTSKAPHGDRLMDFSVGELGLHVVSFKDKTVVPKFKQIFNIPDGVYYGVHIVKLMALLKKKQLSSCCITTGREGELYVDGELLGSVIHNFHVIMMIHQYVDKTSYVLKQRHNVITDVDIDQKLDGNFYYTQLDPTMFDEESSPNWEAPLKILKFPCVDGLTTVSLKSFIPKIRMEYSLKRYYWYEDIRIFSMSVYEDDCVYVRSFRPNILVIPLSTKVNVDYGVQ